MKYGLTGIGLLILAAPLLAVAAPLGAKKPIMIPAGELARAIPEFEAFHGFFEHTKMRILAEENRYLALLEQEARSPAEIEAVRAAAEALRQEAEARIAVLSGPRDMAELACYGETVAEEAAESCATLHDHVQQYEQEVSTLNGMFEVMEARYREVREGSGQ